MRGYCNSEHLTAMGGVNSLQESIASVEITVSATGYTYASFPDGFTRTNTFIASILRYEPGNGCWYLFAKDVGIIISNDGVGIYADSTSAATYGNRFRLLLMKL